MHSQDIVLTTPLKHPQDARAVGVDGVMASRSGGDVLEHTRALQEAMTAERDPKFQNSKFLQFLSKMTQGDIVLEDNQAQPPSPPPRSSHPLHTTAGVSPHEMTLPVPTDPE